ncbi:MAG: hypothetical protein ACXAC7_18255 [Candidatus Hodarchaeales archaeon]|jgi:hypothetical protein
MGSKKYYNKIHYLRCPNCEKPLEMDTDGWWSCPDEQACGYEEQNNITQCHDTDKSCSTLILAKSLKFENLEDYYCEKCISEGINVNLDEEGDRLCNECTGQLILKDKRLICSKCGLILSDEKSIQVVYRMTLVHTKMDLPTGLGKKDNRK